MTQALRDLLRVALAIAIAACGSPVLAAGGQQYTVNMVNMAYGPVPGSLKVGDSLLFVNKDSVPHTVTARNHSFDLRIGPGQRAKLNLTKAGTYQVYCILHAPMRTSFTVGG